MGRWAIKVVEVLLKAYHEEPRPTVARCAALAAKTGLSGKQVANWFRVRSLRGLPICVAYTAAQRATLRQLFKTHGPVPSGAVCNEVAQRLGLTAHQVRAWLRNHFDNSRRYRRRSTVMAAKAVQSRVVTRSQHSSKVTKKAKVICEKAEEEEEVEVDAEVEVVDAEVEAEEEEEAPSTRSSRKSSTQHQRHQQTEESTHAKPIALQSLPINVNKRKMNMNERASEGEEGETSPTVARNKSKNKKKSSPSAAPAKHQAQKQSNRAAPPFAMMDGFLGQLHQCLTSQTQSLVQTLSGLVQSASSVECAQPRDSKQKEKHILRAIEEEGRRIRSTAREQGQQVRHSALVHNQSLVEVLLAENRKLIAAMQGENEKLLSSVVEENQKMYFLVQASVDKSMNEFGHRISSQQFRLEQVTQAVKQLQERVQLLLVAQETGNDARSYHHHHYESQGQQVNPNQATLGQQSYSMLFGSSSSSSAAAASSYMPPYWEAPNYTSL